MNDKEFEKLLTITESEPICIESYMCLKEDCVEGPYGRWGWNKSLRNIHSHFLYVFILGTILQYNEEKSINKIRSEIVMEMINDNSLLNVPLSKKEQKFYEMWNSTSVTVEFDELKKNSRKLCNFLTSLGYKMNFILYKNPKKALNKALELDKYLPEGEQGFGEFLRANIKDEY